MYEIIMHYKQVLMQIKIKIKSPKLSGEGGEEKGT